MSAEAWTAKTDWMRAVGATKATWDGDSTLLSVELGPAPTPTPEPTDTEERQWPRRVNPHEERERQRGIALGAGARLVKIPT